MESLISAQKRNAKESCDQFHRRMMNMVSLLQSTNTAFFHKKMSKSMATEVVRGSYAYSLQFPTDFITKTRVIAYGDGGWKTFLMDNQIKVGDILIFSLLSHSEFQVVIGRAPTEVHPDDNDGAHHNHESSAKWFRNTWPWWNAEQAPLSCRGCKQAPPCPRFLVTIRPSSHPRHLNLAVPGRFWDLHRKRLQCNDLQLRGPNKAICVVKAQRIYDLEEEKLIVCLDSGLEAFRVANQFQVGDILEFFLVANSCFTVDLVQRMAKN